MFLRGGSPSLANRRALFDLPEVTKPNVDIAENKERSYGSFRRVMSLPVAVNVDKISAKLKKWMLLKKENRKN